MNHVLKLVCMAVALAASATSALADDPVQPGRQTFERHCRSCHGGTGPPDSPIGPSLVGIVGRKAGSGPSGVHSRAAIESGIVWERASLRRFLSEPSREMPGTFMTARVEDSVELERLLDYLETLR